MRLEIGSPSPITIVPCTPDQPEDIFAQSRSALNEGVRAAQAGDRLRARASLLRAAELDPKCENAWLWLASVSEVPEELMAYLKNVLAINPENERAKQWMAATRSLLSKTYFECGRVAEADRRREYAAECYRNALDQDDRNNEARFHLAMLSAKEEEKIAILEIVLRHDPEHPEAEAAIRAARQGIIDRRLSAAKALAVSGDRAVAIQEIDSILAAVPRCTEAWMLRSHLVDGFADKLECFDRILSYDPNNSLVAAGRDSLAAIVAAAMPDAAAEEPVSTAHDNIVMLTPEPSVDPANVVVLDEHPAIVEAEPDMLGLDDFGVAPNQEQDVSVLQVGTRTDSQEMQIEFGAEGLTFHRSGHIPSDEPLTNATDSHPDQNVTAAAAKRVLVVDDSPTIRKLISGKLEKSGHAVECAEDGLEALARVEAAVPDLVLLDITMPRMDGYEVCKMIRSREATKDIPVIMISGKDGFFDKVRGRMAGASGYITKPFGPETLMKTVEACLSGEMPEFD